jgi:hypothetical protein
MRLCRKTFLPYPFGVMRSSGYLSFAQVAPSFVPLTRATRGQKPLLAPKVHGTRGKALPAFPPYPCTPKGLGVQGGHGTAGTAQEKLQTEGVSHTTPHPVPAFPYHLYQLRFSVHLYPFFPSITVPPSCTVGAQVRSWYSFTPSGYDGKVQEGGQQEVRDKALTLSRTAFRTVLLTVPAFPYHLTSCCPPSGESEAGNAGIGGHRSGAPAKAVSLKLGLTGKERVLQSFPS